MNPVIVLNHKFITALLRECGVDETKGAIGDCRMEWPVAGVMALVVNVMPSEEQLQMACRAALGMEP